MAVILIDKSAEVRWHEPSVAAVLDPLLQVDALATCAVMDLEILFSARSGSEHTKLARARSGFTYLETSDAMLRRAKELQSLLAKRGQHRAASIADLIISAVAEHHGATVLHYDKDFDLIAKVSRVDARWVVPPGSVS
jgi:predicted nucleic acid-binding protein